MLRSKRLKAAVRRLVPDFAPSRARNQALLKQVSSVTGGRFSPKPAQVFESAGRSISSSMQLWPGLIGLAIALIVAELVLRKWRGIVGSLTRRPLNVDA